MRWERRFEGRWYAHALLRKLVLIYPTAAIMIGIAAEWLDWRVAAVAAAWLAGLAMAYFAALSATRLPPPEGPPSTARAIA